MQRLAELRESRALTLRDLGKKSGVDANTINQIELGHRKARPSTIRKLARALDVEAEDLTRSVGGRSERPKAPTPLSLEWARTADDDEFYPQIAEAPDEDTDTLFRLKGEMERFVHRPLRRELRRRNGEVLEDEEPEPNLGGHPMPVMMTRLAALRAEVRRRGHPFATVKTWAPWIGRTAEVRWNVPEEEWHLYRDKVEEALEGEEYIDVPPDAAEDEPAERELELHHA